MPRMRTETFGEGDMSWLASDHGIFNCRTSVIDISTFARPPISPTAVSAPALRSTSPASPPSPDRRCSRKARLHPDRSADRRRAGLLAPPLWHGLVKTARLPIAHVNATNAADAAGFTFISEAGA